MSHRSGPSTTSRPLLGTHELTPLIRPRSVAVVGASSSGTGFGASALRQLRDADFQGALYSVHASFGRQSAPPGVTGIPSIADLPDPVDCVLVAVPAPAVAEVIEDTANANCRSAIIFTAGFSETAEGAKAEERIRDIAAASGMRLGGPNTAGILNYRDHIPLTFLSDLAMDLPVGDIGIVSQSAGIATHLGHRRHRGAGVSYTITTGNSADVNAFDYVNFLLEDELTRVVVLALEGVDNPSALHELGARSRAAGKPILVLKSGRTTKGSRAAVSHTGSLAGSFQVFQEAAEDAGMIVCASVEELLDSALLFSKWGGRSHRPGGVAVLTTMGGPGVLAADAADDHGVDLPEPSEETRARLGELVPAFAATTNPIDTTAFQSDNVLAECMLALAHDARYAAVIALVATTTGAATAGRPSAIARAAGAAGAPIAAVWLSSWLEAPGSEVLDRDPLVPLFRSSASCFAAIARWMRWHERIDRPDDTDTAAPRELAPCLDDALSRLSAHPVGAVLDEVASRDVLDALGVPVPWAVFAADRPAAVAAAAMIARPVAVKVVSADIPHKAAVGGVALGVTGEDEVGATFDRVTESVRQRRPDADISGVIVAEMTSVADEFMCGVIRDAVFGVVTVCGAGGTGVEQIRDVARCVAPVTLAASRRAVRRLRRYQDLAARDAAAAAALEKGLAGIMVRLAALAEVDPRVAEIDINPVGLSDGRVVALDALVVLS